ncbi:DNA methyltransferase [Pseudomonadota bacterium]
MGKPNLMNTLTHSNELDLRHHGEGKPDGPIECLGQMFVNEQARRDHYLELLAKKLKVPEFRKIAGFPLGSDEAILNLSDPPYYTACPNPFAEDFIGFYGRPHEATDVYCREPYAADVSEGRSGLFYDAHSYHTKVPHKAIMRYLLHYTQPGEIVADVFCGTGMTGVAAQLCGDKGVVESLGYKVDQEGIVYRKTTDASEVRWEQFSKLGARKAILNDLSPAASFISYNFNNKLNIAAFLRQVNEFFLVADAKCRWLYTTADNENERVKLIGLLQDESFDSFNNAYPMVNYIVWSDVFECSNCSSEIVFWEAFYNPSINKLDAMANCVHCGVEQNKKQMNRKRVTEFDPNLDEAIEVVKQVPVMIDYTTADGARKQKKPDEFDDLVVEKVKQYKVLSSVVPLPKGVNTEQPRRSHNVNYMHQFYSARNLYVLTALREIAEQFPYARQLKFLISSYDLSHSTKMTRMIFKSGKKPVLTGYQSGTLYISATPVEKNIIQGIQKQKLPIIQKSFSAIREFNLVQAGSATSIGIQSSSLDYIFIDPPFGANINYSELNYLSESALGVITDSHEEAIENRVQSKSLDDYRDLMHKSFLECYRLLKPGRWITVEFSNTSAAVWNSIQEALTQSGFIISNVSALDKQQGSFKAVTTTTAVKQDLVISAYKPDGEFERRFLEEPDIDGVWEFVRNHLGYVSVLKRQGDAVIRISERDPRILYDQVVAYFVKKLRDVPLSSKEFQEGLHERFSERDGMIFLPEQVAAYDAARISSKKLMQLTIFVDDEASGIEWLRQLLVEKPQTTQSIHPKFINELSGWKKAEVSLELSTLLEQNFLRYAGHGPVPPQIHSYLSTNFKEMRNLAKDDAVLIDKAKGRWYVPNAEREEDLQKIREKDLFKQFIEYKEYSGRKLKTVRLESVRCGFRAAWQDRDYNTIINVAEKIPQNLLQEDQKLLMWYENAQTRLHN